MYGERTPLGWVWGSLLWQRAELRVTFEHAISLRAVPKHLRVPISRFQTWALHEGIANAVPVFLVTPSIRQLYPPHS